MHCSRWLFAICLLSPPHPHSLWTATLLFLSSSPLLSPLMCLISRPSCSHDWVAWYNTSSLCSEWEILTGILQQERYVTPLSVACSGSSGWEVKGGRCPVSTLWASQVVGGCVPVGYTFSRPINIYNFEQCHQTPIQVSEVLPKNAWLWNT